MATAETPQRKTSSKRSSRSQPSAVVSQDQTTPGEMAKTAALTNGSSHRHHHHHHRHHHSTCKHGNQEQTEKSEKSKSKNRPTKQLDFDQAMADFKTMFPTMDCEIIEAVLRANDGAVDATIDQLLTMSIDTENADPDFEIPPELLSSVADDCPLYNEHRSEDSPPSYTEAVSNNIWTTPIPSQQKTEHKAPRRSHSITSTPHRHSTPLFNHSFDELSFSNTEPKLPPPDVVDTIPKKPGFRNWNPPMLGTLPDDFLRLVPPSESFRSFIDNSVDFNEKPRVHHRRHKHSSSRTSSERKKLSQSLVTDDFSSPRSTKLSRSMSERSPIEPLLRTRGSSSGLPLTSQSLIISSHEFTQGMLDKKMKENERRRRTAVMNADLEMSQYLEDERLAIMLQNSEFLQELRGNEEFMQTLEKDQIRKHKKDKKPTSPNRVDSVKSSETAVKRPELPEVPRLVPVPIEEETHEWLSPASEAAAADVRLSFNDDENVSVVGYGDDRQQQLDAFPFSQPIQKDDDAELRRKLKDMGGASKTQFMALAKKFFSRKKSNKRTLKQIQKEKLAPSMLNLLDSEEEDYVPEDDKPYNQETEIEPLPTSILQVPGHKYVQRPPYHPDTIVTYHDNHATDMV